MSVGVTAITLVAMGTSLPDTFASKRAAQESEFADAAVGNVTGSNSVNVFLGLGLPYLIACSYYKSKVYIYIYIYIIYRVRIMICQLVIWLLVLLSSLFAQPFVLVCW